MNLMCDQADLVYVIGGRWLSPQCHEDRSFVAGQLRNYLIEQMSSFYPGFARWYDQKIIEGFEGGIRWIWVVSGLEVEAVSILKAQGTLGCNGKVCTFFVAQSARGMGTGSRMMEESLKKLSEVARRPFVITVPEERLEERIDEASFARFLEKFGFVAIRSLEGRYRNGKKELVFVRR